MIVPGFVRDLVSHRFVIVFPNLPTLNVIPHPFSLLILEFRDKQETRSHLQEFRFFVQDVKDEVRQVAAMDLSSLSGVFAENMQRYGRAKERDRG